MPESVAAKSSVEATKSAAATAKGAVVVAMLLKGLMAELWGMIDALQMSRHEMWSNMASVKWDKSSTTKIYEIKREHWLEIAILVKKITKPLIEVVCKPGAVDGDDVKGNCDAFNYDVKLNGKNGLELNMKFNSPIGMS